MKKIFFIVTLICILSFNTLFSSVSSMANTTNEISYSSTKNIPFPIVHSKSIIVLDRKTLLPLYEKNAYKKMAMASTTKILTCIIALENSSKDDIVTVSKKASNVSGSTLGLKNNSKVSMNNLLYGLMLRSGNDCAIAIAEHISGSVENFSSLMNSKAFELGLFNSNFVTPHGLDDSNHFTTAYDLALLTNYALQNEEFKKIVSTKTKVISIDGNLREISNTNELLGNVDGVYGVKTGFTFEAGRCLVSACKKENLDIIVVVLGADSKSIRTQDSKNLINYIFDNYKYINVSNIINNSFNNYLSCFNKIYNLEKTCTTPILKLERLDNYDFALCNTDISNLNTKIYTQTNFNSSIFPKNTVGKIYLYNNETLLCSVNIFLENTLIPNDWRFYFKQFLSYYK